jgi:hypothetical protein
MLRPMLCAALLAAAMATPASAAMNCGATHDKHATDITKMSGANADKRAALHRMALAGYDHCMAGDEFNAMKFFDMIEKQRK